MLWSCVVLCCVVLCSVVLCCVVLCCVVLCCVPFCSVMCKCPIVQTTNSHGFSHSSSASVYRVQNATCFCARLDNYIQVPGAGVVCARGCQLSTCTRVLTCSLRRIKKVNAKAEMKRTKTLKARISVLNTSVNIVM